MAETAKAAVTIEDGSVRSLDIIDYEGEHWLVADWISLARNSPKHPRRLFRLASLAHQPGGVDDAGAEIKVMTPLTDALLRGGPAPEGSGIDILDCQYKLDKNGALRPVGFAPPMQKTRH